MTIGVEGRRLSVSYGKRRVFEGVDVAVRSGELAIVVGPNGSGKSSLLRVLAGIQKPTRGVVERSAPVLLIGSQTSPPPDVTPRDLAGYGLALRRAWYRFSPTPAEEVAVEEALALADLSDRAGDAIGTMSAGEVQRAWIAAALASKPGALLVDEPTSHLDLRYQIDVIRTLQTLATGGVAVAAAVHDLSLAARFADTVWVLSGGRLLSGSPEAVLTPEILSRAYDIDVSVHRHPDWGFLLCTPSSENRSRS